MTKTTDVKDTAAAASEVAAAEATGAVEVTIEEAAAETFAAKPALAADAPISKLFMCIGIIFVSCLILSNLIAGKMWAVTDSITLPAAVILFPLTYIFGDIFTEVYGFKKARLVIWMGFAMSFFAVLIYLIVIGLPHPGFWEGQDAYETVMGTTPRVAIASFAGYLFGEFSNSIILSKLKVATKGKNLWMRTILSTVVGVTPRETSLGFIQRGGNPTYADRMLGVRMGATAVDLLAGGCGAVAVGVRGGEIFDTDLAGALGIPSDIDQTLYDLAPGIV